MKDEIKEILEELRKTADNTVFVVCSSQEELDKIPKYTANFLSVNDRQAKILLDYITNLKHSLYEEQELNEYLQDKIKKLQQEINRLNNIIDKAIEYMKNYIEVEDAPINERIKIEFKELLDILKGDNK